MSERRFPDPRQIEALVERLAAAKCPVILAGRGVMRAGAAGEVEQLAERAEVWNIHVSDRVVSPSTRRGVGRGHGKM
jgi:thiamine pyrophosphate-dependent acetolactate synthase large subunit-like protein